MSLKRYDEALEIKLKLVFPNVRMADDEKAFEISATQEEDVVVKLPLITFARINNALNLEQYGNDRAIRRGRFVKEEGLRVKTFPINIIYQIDIWSDRREEVDEIWRELVQLLYEEPEIDVEFGGLGTLESFPMRMMDTDNTSDITSFSDRGRIYRQTINLEIEQAKMLFRDNVNLAESFEIRLVTIGAKEEVEVIMQIDSIDQEPEEVSDV